MKKILSFIALGCLLQFSVNAQNSDQSFMHNKFHEVGAKINLFVNFNSTGFGGNAYYLLNSNKKFSANPGIGLTYFETETGDYNYYSESKFYGLEGILSLKYRPINFGYLSFNTYVGGGRQYLTRSYFNSDTSYSKNSKAPYFLGSCTLGVGFRIKCIDFHGEGGLSIFGPNFQVGAAYIFPRKNYIIKPN